MQFNNIKLWNLARGESTTIKSESKIIDRVAISPGGLYLALGTSSGVVYLWDVTNSKSKATLTGHSKSIKSLSFSPDGLTLASGSTDSTVKIWKVSSGQLNATLTLHTGEVSSVVFSQDGLTLASGSKDGSVIVWDLSDKDLFKVAIPGKEDNIEYIALSPDGQSVAVRFDNGKAELRDTVNGKFKASLTQNDGRDDYVRRFVFSADSSTLVVDSNYDGIDIWDVNSGSHVNWIIPIPNARTEVALSGNGRLIATDSGVVIDVATGEYKPNLDFSSVGSDSTKYLGLTRYYKGAVALSPDGQTLATAKPLEGRIYLWSVHTGSLKKFLNLSDASERIEQIVFSPDNLLLASGSGSGSVKLWDINTGQLKPALDAHTEAITHIAFSPDSQFLVSCSYDNTVKLWDLVTGEISSIVVGILSSCDGSSFTQDNSTLKIFGEDDKFIRAYPVTQFDKLKSSSFLENWIYRKGATSGLYLDGLDLKIKQTEPNLYGTKNPIKPRWSKNHPFHWLESANNGNAEAMLQLGIIYHRIPDNQKAKHWYNKALEAGHPKAKQRLEVLEQTSKHG